jgi:hypothetical protein
MHYFKLAAAATIALLCLSPSLALAAVHSDGDRTISMVDDGPALDHGVGFPEKPTIDRGQVNPNKSVGAEFIVANGPILKLSPYSVACSVMRDAFKQGVAEIWFKNTGSETIPAGSILTVTYSDGTVVMLEVSDDIKPGASGGIVGPFGSNEEGFSCKAKVKVKPPGLDNPTLGH